MDNYLKKKRICLPNSTHTFLISYKKSHHTETKTKTQTKNGYRYILMTTRNCFQTPPRTQVKLLKKPRQSCWRTQKASLMFSLCTGDKEREIQRKHTKFYEVSTHHVFYRFYSFVYFSSFFLSKRLDFSGFLLWVKKKNKGRRKI